MRLEYFQMVDRIVSLDVTGRRIAATCQVPETSPVFEGHFPGHPILPGVLMIETMAQTGGWLIMATLRFKRMPLLIQVEKAKMRSFVIPGALLAAEAELLHDGSGYAVVKASISSRKSTGTSDTSAGAGDKKVAEAEIRYGLMPFPNDDLKAVLLESARRIGVPEQFFHAE
jgi:3-hydroxyacyl-[acyl-carrier-protein] dehydratase